MGKRKYTEKSKSFPFRTDTGIPNISITFKAYPYRILYSKLFQQIQMETRIGMQTNKINVF